MTHIDQRIALCRWMGWKNCKKYVETLPTPCGRPPEMPLKSYRTELPNLTLEWLFECERRLTIVQQNAYTNLLYRIERIPDDVNHAMWLMAHATAVQRAEALLKTIGKWKEETRHR